MSQAKESLFTNWHFLEFTFINCQKWCKSICIMSAFLVFIQVNAKISFTFFVSCDKAIHPYKMERRTSYSFYLVRRSFQVVCQQPFVVWKSP